MMNYEELTIERARELLSAYNEVKKNPLVLSLFDQLRKKHDETVVGILDGGFPPPASNRELLADVQGVLLREQMIGEAKALRYGAGLLDTVIQILQERVAELQETEKKEEPNES